MRVAGLPTPACVVPRTFNLNMLNIERNVQKCRGRRTKALAGVKSLRSQDNSRILEFGTYVHN